MTQELPEGTVTILFTDVVGSTDLTTARGDEAARQVLRAHEELVRQQVQEHGGHEVKAMGDGFMMAFASARRAVACAVGIQRALSEHNRQGPADGQVLVRIGLNTGEVIQEEADLFGEAVNAAARIAAKAKGGQILISETARGVIGRAQDLKLLDRGRFRLKGFPERWRLYEVVWQKEAPVAVVPLVERTPFVGRETERAELRRLLEQAIGGRGALAMIGGEPGVGKTRLSEELMAEAGQRGLTTLIGHCYEMEGTPPYIPFVEMLEATARTATPEAFRAALGDAAAEVARIMPELRRLFPDIPAPLELPPEQERRYLFNSLREFLERAGRVNPLLLVLDDLHWGDDSTLLLLEHIAQQLGQMPVLIIGTYRDVELDVGRPLARTLETLLRQRLAHRIALKRLPQAGVEAMLRALSGQEPPTPLVGVIYSETEGNPFFVEEVFQHLAEEGKFFDDQGRWRSDLQVSELDVPEGVRLVISRRLQRVSEECRRVLTSAAVIGRGFSFELLEALADAEPDALLDTIDEAERAQLITATSEGREARFTFAHELIRQTLISGLSLPRRQRLHLRVAEAIERVYAADLEPHAADLAHHLYRAGAASDPEKTVRYLTLAGERALAAGAFEEALRHYENAIPLQPAGEPRGLADLLFKRGLARRSLGRWDEALADWRQALDAYEGLADGQAVGAVAAEVVVQLLWGARFLEAVEISRRGLIALGQVVNADRCRLLAYGGLILSFGGNYAAGEGMINQALLMAQNLGDRRLLGEALVGKAMHHWSHMQCREAFEAGLHAAELLRNEGAAWQLADALWVALFSALYLGEFDRVHQINEEVEPLAARIGHLGAARQARVCREARELSLTADIDRFHAFIQNEIELDRSLGVPWISNSYSLLASVHLWKGRWPEALDTAQEAARLEPPGFAAGWDWGALFLVRAYAGQHDRARAMFAEKRSELPRPGSANTGGKWNIPLAMVEGLAVIGDRDEAANLLPLVSEAMATGVLIYSSNYRLLQTVAGIAAAAGSQWEKAEAHYQTALRQAHELPHKIEQPEVRRWYARMLLDRNGPGDREKARELLTEAIAMYRRIGMPKHVAMAEALLAEAGS
ncbi:MAG: AAA family ATPase [Dehalococcoidia bacterium]|nr:AAA family ATPase [Dehalococcoidia bacterium]